MYEQTKELSVFVFRLEKLVLFSHNIQKCIKDNLKGFEASVHISVFLKFMSLALFKLIY